MDLAEGAYRLARSMPKQEEYRLSAQLIRCAASVPANLAEGHTRTSRKDYAHFVSIARGSLAELKTFLLLIDRLELAPKQEIGVLVERAAEVGRMLTGLRSKLLDPGPNPQPLVPSP
jgi:four helix bundle protein